MSSDDLRDQYVEETLRMNAVALRRPLRRRLAWAAMMQLVYAAALVLSWFMFGRTDGGGMIFTACLGGLAIESMVVFYVIAPQRYFNVIGRIGAPGDGPKNPFVGMP